MRRLHPHLRTPASERHDRRYSATTVAIMLALGAATTVLVLDGVMPLSLDCPSIATFVVESALYVLLFDAYFYGLHRVLHTRILFRRIHAVHHRSRAPTLATALALHPVEAVLVLGFMPVAMWFVPVHLASVVAVSVFLGGSILLAHCGWDVFPASWERTSLVGWYVTPRVHDAHHRRRDCNFSATLSLFDRAFGTAAVSARRS